jgi:hypothetical protein
MLQRLDTTARPERPDGEPSRTQPTRPTPVPERPSLEPMPLPTRPRLELSMVKILAGALAAASAAVAASWLGVAGTVAGAVIASVVVSVTTALYSHPIERGSKVIREVIPAVPTKYRASDATGATETMLVDPAEPPAQPVDTSLAEQPRPRVRWATVALSAIVMLVVGFAVITGVEAVLGRPISAIGGDGSGTTLSHIVHHSNGGTHSTPSNGGQGDDSTQPPTTGSTDAPTSGAPTTDEPTPTEPTPTEPTGPTESAPTTAPATGAASGAAGAPSLAP